MATCAELANELSRLRNLLQHVTDAGARQDILDQIADVQRQQRDQGCVLPLVSVSGVHQGVNRQSFLVTQGLSGCTLVAAKQCLFRLFMNPQQLGQVNTVILGTPSYHIDQGKSSLIFETNSPNGPSVGLIIPGNVFPKSGQYAATLSARDARGAALQTTSFELFFYPTKDLRLLVTFLVHTGVFGPTDAWYTDIQRSMLRLGSMFPVRDGVQNSLNGDTCNGLRYVIGTPCDGFTSGYYDCVYGQTRQINASQGDHIDVTVEYRPGFYAPEWNPPGDPNPGGNSGRPPSPYSDLRRVNVVAGRWNNLETTAPVAAQELGHNFGLEPPTSPHFQDPNDPGHSKDPLITDPYAYDFVNKRPYNRQIGDTMNNGGGWEQGADAVAFNAYDWEYFRGGIDGGSGLMALQSTGTEVNPCPLHRTGIGGYDLMNPADRAFAFDYDSSGKLDHLTLYRPGIGVMWILKNNGGQFAPVYEGFGIGGYDLMNPADRAFAFDYDSSGKLDHLVLYRPNTGAIFILKNSAGQFTPVYAQGDPGSGIGGYNLKSPADRVFAFDYDGSGKLDHLALYQPGTGTMWILKNNGGQFSPVYAQGSPGNGIGGYDLKSPADRVFAFDYDGSGKLDHLVLYRPNTGAIFILKNSAGQFTPVYAQGDPGSGIGGYDLKSPADRVFAFDYDGSGKLDHLVLYRPGTGMIWILNNSALNFAPIYQAP